MSRTGQGGPVVRACPVCRRQVIHAFRGDVSAIGEAQIVRVDRDGNEMYAVLTNPQVFNAMNACSVSAWVSRCRDDGLRFALMDPGELREAGRPESLAG